MEKREKTMHEMIMEDVKRNPILTDEEIREMLEPESEEEIRQEEELTEAICDRIDLLIEEKHDISDEEFQKIVKEERIKRGML